jgi:Zinc knuckle.
MRRANCHPKIRRGSAGTSGLSFVQTDGELKPGTNGKAMDHATCHKCKKVGHYANKCPQAEEEESGSANDGQVSTHALFQSHHTSNDQPINHIQLTMTAATLDQEIILLDSQSSVHVFNNRELLTDMRLHPEGKTLRVYSNGGHMDSWMVGQLGNIVVWYNP